MLDPIVQEILDYLKGTSKNLVAASSVLCADPSWLSFAILRGTQKDYDVKSPWVEKQTIGLEGILHKKGDLLLCLTKKSRWKTG